MTSFLNPITLEANFLIKTIEEYSTKYQTIDEELLNTMDKLVDAINKFCDQAQTKVEETDNLKLIRVEDVEYLSRSYQCTKCRKYLGFYAEKAALHLCAVHQKTRPGTESGICQDKDSHPRSDEGKQTLQQKQPRSRKNRAIVNVPVLPKKARFLLTKKFDKFFREPCEIAEKLKQCSDYSVIEDDLMSILQCVYPDKKFKTYKFGSRISGIGNVDSDLDIFVDMDGSFHDFNHKPTDEIQDVISAVSIALKKNSKWTHVISIQNARVPIIRLKHVLTKIDCDIGFSNSLGYCNTMLMQYLFELQPIAARMSIYLKSWLERISHIGNVSTYSFTLLIIYYLQICFVLPSIEDLQEDLEKKEFIGPWLVNFNKKSLKELNLEPVEVTKENLQDRLCNFFLFYGEFDFDRWVICPYKGEMVQIADVNEELPERFKDFVKSREDYIALQLNKPMVVQDPFELSHNVTKGVSKTLLKYFSSYFLESARIITNQPTRKTIIKEGSPC